ncbi:MAG: metallophosphoesterase family protein [Desulfobulbaceae bacterium]|nr:metallophosphoesterase family protein [Desulfobulbaceae bacterium]
MRTAVLADIHANLAALEAVLEDILAERISDTVILGDNIGYGPDPEEVIRELVKQQAVSVQGNHEYALDNPHYYRMMNPDPKKSLDMTRIMLSEESLAYARELPAVIIHHGARLVHGCPPDSRTEYLFYPGRKKLAKIFNSFPERICFYGHTHTLNFFDHGAAPIAGLDVNLGVYHLKNDRKYIINPGSVGQPRDGINNSAKYLIWDRVKDTVTFKALKYDVMRTVNRLRALGFPEFNATRLLW